MAVYIARRRLLHTITDVLTSIGKLAFAARMYNDKSLTYFLPFSLNGESIITDSKGLVKKSYNYVKSALTNLIGHPKPKVLTTEFQVD